MIEIKLPTWTCDKCGYAQDFDPGDRALHDTHHPETPFGVCPSCGAPSAVTPELDPAKQTTVAILEHHEVDALTDEAGNPLPDETKAELKQQITDTHAQLGLTPPGQ